MILQISSVEYQITTELIGEIWGSAPATNQFKTVTSEYGGEGPYRGQGAWNPHNLPLAIARDLGEN